MTSELEDIISEVNPGELEALVDALYDAKRNGRKVCCYGVGREGLVIKGFAMRLFHMGVQVGMVGDMTCPPVGPGDLLLVSAGPGFFSTVAALAGQARAAGATVIAFTAQGSLLEFADFTVCVPAATMPIHGRGDSAAPPRRSTLPMGSSYEAALWLLLDVLALVLQREMGLAESDLSRNHTNLE